MKNTEEKPIYRTETHLHTAESSFCAMLSARRMLEIYHEKGYKTVFITDHLTEKTFEKYDRETWEESVWRYLRGYREAKVVGDKLGMNVILGAEITLTESPNDYLAYGITREFMLSHPEIYNLTRDELDREAKKYGIFLVQSHPYRDGMCFPTPDCVDGVEVYNSNPRHNDFSDKSLAVARENGLYITAGSDAHREDDAALSGIITDTEIKTSDDFISVIKSGEFTIIE